MSGYAAYVWPCYGLTLAVLIWNVWSARLQLREQALDARRRADAQGEPAPQADTGGRGEEPA